MYLYKYMGVHILKFWLKPITRNTVWVCKDFFRIKKTIIVEDWVFQSIFDREPPLFPFSPHGITAQPVTMRKTKVI